MTPERVASPVTMEVVAASLPRVASATAANDKQRSAKKACDRKIDMIRTPRGSIARSRRFVVVERPDSPTLRGRYLRRDNGSYRSRSCVWKRRTQPKMSRQGYVSNVENVAYKRGSSDARPLPVVSRVLSVLPVRAPRSDLPPPARRRLGAGAGMSRARRCSRETPGGCSAPCSPATALPGSGTSFSSTIGRRLSLTRSTASSATGRCSATC